MAKGLIADPDRPRELKDAVTPRGTCPDMCPEFERLSRISGKDIMVPECSLDTANLPRKDRVPDESRMVKRYRRPAAGNEEALPSELRPPLVLQVS
jgi:nuclear mRNA export protein SAC3